MTWHRARRRDGGRIWKGKRQKQNSSIFDSKPKDAKQKKRKA